MTTKNKLPTKLSALLRVAVGDAKKCAKDPRYTLAMEVWHDPTYGKPNSCAVCMGGAVMAQQLHVSPNKHLLAMELPEHKPSLMAIDEMREGSFVAAAQRLLDDPNRYSDVLDEAQTAVMKTYRNNRDGGRAQWRSYLAAARILEGAGL